MQERYISDFLFIAANQFYFCGKQTMSVRFRNELSTYRLSEACNEGRI